jgi:hypothetical protein
LLSAAEGALYAGGLLKSASLALGLMGSDAGAEVLISALISHLAGPQLPRREAFVQHANKFAPDQAAMPDAANWLYTLGMLRTRAALPVWQRVVDLLAGAREEDIWSQDQGIFAYVDALCLGAERLGDRTPRRFWQLIYPAFQQTIVPASRPISCERRPTWRWPSGVRWRAAPARWWCVDQYLSDVRPVGEQA